MKNVIQQLLELNIEFFITVSFISSFADEDMFSLEYHIYHKIPQQHRTRYTKVEEKYKVGYYHEKEKRYNLKLKKLTNGEIRWMKRNMDKFNCVLSNKYGKVYHFNTLPFVVDSKENNQLTFF